MLNSSILKPARALGLLLGALCCAAPVSIVFAQEHAPQDVAAAREHFEVGTTLYRSGRFAEAASEYLQAYDLSGEPDLLHNVYLSYRDAGDVVRAAAMLRRYLDEATGLEPDVRALLTHRVEAMEHAVAAAGDGPTPVVPDQSAPEDGALDAPTGAAPVMGLGTESPTTSASSEPPWGAITAFSLAGLGVIGAAVVGPLALSRRDELATTCAPRCTSEEADSVRTLGVITDVSLGVAAAGAIAGIVLWLVQLPAEESGPHEDAISVAPAVDAQGASLHVAHRF